MTRKRARKLMLEMVRRIHLQHNGTLEGFGGIAKFYRADWKPNINRFGGYKSAWNSKLMRDLRATVGM